MEQLAHFFSQEMLNSATVTLMLLGAMEQATRYSVGCEGLLGWWPREGEKVPSGVSEGYSLLLKLLMQKQRHDIAALTTYILHRLRFYEVASRYEVYFLDYEFFIMLQEAILIFLIAVCSTFHIGWTLW